MTTAPTPTNLTTAPSVSPRWSVISSIVGVGDQYASVVAQGRDLQRPGAHSAAPHRPIEAPPVQGPKDWRDDDIEISAECIARCMTHDLGYCVPPLVNDAVAIDGHSGALAITGRVGSVHTWITVHCSHQFTHAGCLQCRDKGALQGPADRVSTNVAHR
jgi:hypothetical protein